MTDLRFIDRLLSAGVRFYAEYRNYPVFEYAVMLQIEAAGGRWQTIRLFDNAHGVNEMHLYTEDEKQPAEPFLEDRPSNEAMPRMIDYLVDNWQEVVEEWKSGA